MLFYKSNEKVLLYLHPCTPAHPTSRQSKSDSLFLYLTSVTLHPKDIKSFSSVALIHSNPWSRFHCTYLPMVILLYDQTEKHPYSNHRKNSWRPTVPTYTLPSHAYVLRLNLRTNFNNKHIHTRTNTHTHAHGLKHTHTYVRTQKYLSLIPSSIPFFSAPATVHTNFNCAKFTKLAQTWKLITYSGFRYNIFINKPYDHTPFKKIITDSRFLTSHSLMFNPACAKRKLPSSSGIRFHVPVVIYISFVKRVKPKSAWIHSWLHNTTDSRSVI